MIGTYSKGTKRNGKTSFALFDPIGTKRPPEIKVAGNVLYRPKRRVILGIEASASIHYKNHL